MDDFDCFTNGYLYLTKDPKIRAYKKAKNEFLDAFNSTKNEDKETRIKLAKAFFGDLGEDANLYKPFYCDFGYNIHIGNQFFSNYNVMILDEAPIYIGDCVFLGPNVHIYAAAHPIDPTIRNEKLTYGRSVKIGNSVWIGGNSTINPGVTIGDNVVIGSSSVVTHDIPSNVVAVGNPCRVLRKITDEDKKYWENKKQERIKYLKLSK